MPVTRSTRPEIRDPDPVGPVRNRHFGVPVAKIAMEDPRFVLPPDTVADPPLRRDPRGYGASSPGSLLAGLARFAAGKTCSAAHRGPHRLVCGDKRSVR